MILYTKAYPFLSLSLYRETRSTDPEGLPRSFVCFLFLFVRSEADHEAIVHFNINGACQTGNFSVLTEIYLLTLGACCDKIDMLLFNRRFRMCGNETLGRVVKNPESIIYNTALPDHKISGMLFLQEGVLSA